MRRQAHYLALYFEGGLRQLWRGRFSSAVLFVAVSLLMFAVYTFVAMSEHTRQAARKVDDRLVVTAILAQDSQLATKVPGAPPAPAATTPADPSPGAVKLRSEALRIPNVRSVRIVTKQENRARFLENIGKLRAVPAAYIFPEALEVSVQDVKQMAPVRDAVARLGGVRQATYLGELVRKLTAVSGYLQRAALYGAILLGIVAAAVLMLVVRAAMHQERRSVQTMSSVGGSPMTIAAPLLVQTLLVTAAACALACLAGWWIDPQLGSTFSQSIHDLPAWLKTGRAFGLFELLPAMALAACSAVALIVAYGTMRYARADAK